VEYRHDAEGLGLLPCDFPWVTRAVSPLITGALPL